MSEADRMEALEVELEMREVVERAEEAEARLQAADELADVIESGLGVGCFGRAVDKRYKYAKAALTAYREAGK